MIGMILGNRYEIIKEIGSGGMANVYLAQCRLLNRPVAVKVLKNEFVNDTEFLERFNKEAQAAAAISSPNIVNVYDVGHDGDTHYIVMEYVEGQTLKEYIDHNGMLSWQETVEYATQICSALDKAHKNNIIHRDIKPQNIILTNDGVLKVTDFGIARASSNETLNMGESTMGSVHYFSPEQARGGFTDAKSDIYSLGVVMYELVTGVLPFTGDTPIAIAIKHMQQKPISPKEYNISVPLAVENIILKAMSKEQRLRYQSAAEMLDDLIRVAADPDSVPESHSGGGDTIKYEPVNEFPEFVIKDEPEEKPVIEETDEKAHNKGKKDKRDKKKVDKGVRNAVILAIISALAVFGVIILLGFSLLGGCSKEIEIPDVIGMTYDEAVEQYGKDFAFVVEKNVESDEYEPGVILEQNPAGGRTTKSVKEIKISVSKDSESFIMPDFVGAKIDFLKGSLQKEIEEYGIEILEIEETDEKFAEGEVIKTIPAKNEKIGKGDTITVYVSLGKPVLMPDLVGMTYGEAKELLDSMEIKIKAVIPGIATDEYLVDWQSIDPDDEVSEDDEVSLRLKAPIEEPPAVEEPPVVDNPPAVEEPPVVDNPPAREEPPVVDNPPAVEEPPAVDNPPAAEEPPVADNPPAEPSTPVDTGASDVPTSANGL